MESLPMKILIQFISALFLLSLISCSGRSSVSAGDQVGEILYLEGTVSVDGVDGEIGQSVMDGNTVKTGPDSYVEIKFGDSRVLKAEENTRLVLDAGEKTFRLKSGALAVVQSKTRWFIRNNSWLVETPTMAATVRGTVYYTKVESPDEVYFCLCNGKIHLEDSNAVDSVNLEAAHHRAVRFVRGNDGIVHQDSTLLYHDDRVMEAVADEVNVSINWSRIP